MTSMGQLGSYEDFANWVKNQSASSRYSDYQAPKQFAGMVQSPGEGAQMNRNAAVEPSWTQEEWIGWLSCPEGQAEIEAGNIADPVGMRALCTMYKGKGKGSGGQGGFSGTCWTCGKTGHRAFECPEGSKAGKGGKAENKGKGKRQR